MDTNVLQVKLISDANMEIRDFIPICNILIGGFLTIAGGFFLHLLTTRKEKKELSRKKLEELYILTCKLTDWAAYKYIEVIHAASKIKPDSPKVVDPINELVMVIRLYHPSLSENASNVKRLASELQKYCFSLIVDFANPNTRTDNTTRIAKIVDHMNELQKANEILQEKISQRIQKFI